MAISRSLMNRQLQANGGIMQVAPREKFGLGSSIKKFARKIIPNEIADIAVKAAPFVAPFNPALAGAMAGIGSFDQTGSIGDSLKRGALTYGGGQAARYIGGAGFQDNPFASGGAFTRSGFTSGFSSPIGSETGLGKFFSNRGTEGVQGINVDSGRGGTSSSALSRSSANMPGAEALASEVSYQPPVVTGSGNNPFRYKDTVTKSVSESLMDPAGAAGKSRALGDTILKTTVDKSVVTKEPGFLKNIFDGVANQDYQKVAKTIGDGVKKFGKAMFTNKDGSIDKAAVMGALAFSASYAEARALAAETGLDEDLTEAEYDEARKAEKQEEYAGYLTNFFGGVKDGGRIGFKKGSPKEPSEIGIMTIDVEAGDDDMEDMDMAAGISFSSAEKSYLFRRLGGAGGASRSYTMPMLYKILNSPGSYPNDAAILKQIAIMGLGKKDGGRIGFAEGTPDKELEKILATDSTISSSLNDPRNMTTEDIIAIIKSGRSTPEMFEELLLRGYTGVDSIMLDEIGGKKLDAPQQAYSFRPDGESGVIEDFLFKLRESNPDIYGEYSRPKKTKQENFYAETRAKGGRIGYKGGANRVSELLVLRDSMLAKDADADVSDIEAEIFQLTGKVFKSMGGIGDVPTGKLRQNNAGVIERDYRDEGGFVPVGIKERADDVPAMLSKNEFVMTADAVRGIGGGDVEKGSKKLYNTMKQAEKVGKA